MQGFVDKLASAIATAEGFFASDTHALPQRLFNPGDLRAAPWLQGYRTVSGFVQFPSKNAGIAGLFHQIALDIARGWSLRKLVYTYAPPGDNNDSANYLKETARRIGLDLSKDIDTPLWNFLEIEAIP